MLTTSISPCRPFRMTRGPWVAAGFAAMALLPTSFAGASAQSSDRQVLDLSTTSTAAKEHFWAGVEETQNVAPTRAAGHLAQAMEADPGFGLASVLHGFVAPGLSGEERRAQMAAGLALMGGATTDELLLAAALRAWQSGEQADASRILLALSELNGDDAHVQSWTDQLAGARGDRTDAIARFPDFAPPHNTLAYTLWARGDQQGAYAAVGDYARMHADHPNPHDSYAEILQFDGRYQDALQHYGRAAELDPSYEASYAGAAETYVLMGEHGKAAEQMARAAEHAETPASRINSLRGEAAVHTLAGDRTRAMEALATAAERAEADGLNGAAAVVHFQMAMTAGLLGREREIEAHVTRGNELAGSPTPLHRAMAAVAFAVGDQRAAAREAAGQIGGDNAAAASAGHAAIALVLVREGSHDEAMTELAMANTADPLARAVMAIGLDAMGRKAEAAAKRADVVGLRQFALANTFTMVAKSLAARK